MPNLAPNLDAALQGFLLGFSLILAIGAQNAFVLRQGIRREHVFPVALTCAVSDAALIAAGVGGFAGLVELWPGLVPAMRWGGAIFLIAYGARAFLSAWRGGAGLEPGGNGRSSLGRVLATCLALTWLNPHVYLDTVVLIGSISSGFPNAKPAFAAGAMTSSFVFFFSLAYGARVLAPVLSKPRAWQLFEALIGLIMWAIALGLILG